jgi:TetR/AcrR family transcriptional regulator, regulator of biofilm formation and stress response
MSAATTHSETPRPRGAARRDALLEAVLKIVGEVGAEAVTHRRVAEVADLPLASTTYYFESKEHLLTAALELAAERDIARLNEFAVHPVTADDPIGLAIAALLDPTDETGPSQRGSMIANYALLLEAARRPALQAVARRWTEAYLDVLGRLLAAAGSAEPAADAELLMAAADGLLIEQLTAGTRGDLAPRLRRLATALVVKP